MVSLNKNIKSKWVKYILLVIWFFFFIQFRKSFQDHGIKFEQVERDKFQDIDSFHQYPGPGSKKVVHADLLK